jgi:hypothetical protein
LKFKTTARDGLLFLAGKGHTFLSVELRDGNVVYQVWSLSTFMPSKPDCLSLFPVLLFLFLLAYFPCFEKIE